MEQVSLNLTRKWRATNFQEIIGQELVVRILQNSLFKNQFFPVYLLSGQRGCGKTSTARVFASALNCRELNAFQKNPKIKIPCMICDSCSVMKIGQHPDFIEIDAASYTGVDNIRNIIDTSSFLPVLGERKVYLIDEVHMLSKAAFNALLKILEEPPKFVVFILATTEVQKLPETIRSRCFQLFFNSIIENNVVKHLENVCQKESIAYDIAGLEIIAQVTQGSLRDAINLLEQARFADSKVSKSIVLTVLGYIDDERLYQLLFLMMNQKHEALMQYMQEIKQQSLSIDYFFKRILELIYDCIILKYGGNSQYMIDIPKSLQQELHQIDVKVLVHWFDELCKLDMVLFKTSKKQLLLEFLIFKLVIPEYQNYQHPIEDQKKKSIES